MKILVTGSDGYIGGILVPALIHKGYSVYGIDTGFYTDNLLLKDNKINIYTLKKDIRQVNKEDLVGFGAIIHLAELSNDPLGQIDPNLTLEINHKGTQNLVRAAKKAKIKRFVYLSSCSVYGASNSLRDENSKVRPLTVYSKCKRLNETLLLREADSFFTPTILRSATAFGYSPNMRFDLVVNNLAGHAKTTKVIKMKSDGGAWRPFIHVADIADGIIAVLEAKRSIIQSEVFNLGEDRLNYQIKEIADRVAEAFGNCRIRLNADNKDRRNYRVSFRKINKILPSFSCKYDLATGLKELKTVFTKANLTKRMFKLKTYTRLEAIKNLIKSRKLDKNLTWI